METNQVSMDGELVKLVMIYLYQMVSYLANKNHVIKTFNVIG